MTKHKTKISFDFFHAVRSKQIFLCFDFVSIILICIWDLPITRGIHIFNQNVNQTALTSWNRASLGIVVSQPQATCCFKRTFNPLKQEEADPGPARVALAAPAHAVLSHGCVWWTSPWFRVAATSTCSILVPRCPASHRPRTAGRKPREVQFVLHHTTIDSYYQLGELKVGTHGIFITSRHVSIFSYIYSWKQIYKSTSSIEMLSDSDFTNVDFIHVIDER